MTTSKLAIFDSGLGALKLPILRSLTFDGDDEGSTSTVRHRDSLSTLLERYLEWKVEFPEGEHLDLVSMGSDLYVYVDKQTSRKKVGFWVVTETMWRMRRNL